MADTGAPWNIPYVEPSDLVRDYPAADEAQADAIAAGLDAAGNAGIGSNVVSTTLTSTFTVSLAAGATGALTGLTATITPSSDTSKILVLYYVTGTNADGFARSWATQLLRGATEIALGDAAGSRRRINASAMGPTDAAIGNISSVILDSPGTASPVTYSLKLVNNSFGTATVFVNRSPTDTDSNIFGRATSSITVIEVAP